MKKKSKIVIALLFATNWAFISCSDWTDIESVDIKQPNIEEQNPELYTKYLENLRQYKSSEHKQVYAWFDNSEKKPYSRAQHLVNLPDSIDAVTLMYPDNLAEWEQKEIIEIRERKGIKTYVPIDFDEIKAIYNARLEISTEEEPIAKDFQTYLVDTLNYSLNLVRKYNYDGICIGYNGKAILNMLEEEKPEYIANEKLFIGIINDWKLRNTSKTLAYSGKPQNLMDKSLLEDCSLILLSEGLDATNKDLYTYYLSLAAVEGVPTERLAMMCSTTSMDTDDTKTGYLGNGERCIPAVAEWAAIDHGGISVAGIGIKNISTDYYIPAMSYQYTRNAISIINPSIK